MPAANGSARRTPRASFNAAPLALIAVNFPHFETGALRPLCEALPEVDMIASDFDLRQRQVFSSVRTRVAETKEIGGERVT
jgi:hypothetical protein